MQKQEDLVHIDFLDLYLWNDFVVKFTIDDGINKPSYSINKEDAVLYVKLPASFNQGGNFNAEATLYLEKNEAEIRQSYVNFVDSLRADELLRVFDRQPLSSPFIFEEATKRLDIGTFIGRFLVYLINFAHRVKPNIASLAHVPCIRILQEQTAILVSDNFSYLQNQTEGLALQLQEILGNSGELSDQDADDDADDDDGEYDFKVVVEDDLDDDDDDDDADYYDDDDDDDGADDDDFECETIHVSIDDLNALSSVSLMGFATGVDPFQLIPKVLIGLEHLEELLKQNSKAIDCSYQQALALVPITDVKMYHGAEQTLRKSIRKRLADATKDTINKLEFLDLSALRALNVVVASHPKLTREFFNLAVEAIGGVNDFLCGISERHNLSNFIDCYQRCCANGGLETNIANDCHGFFDSSVDLLGRLSANNNNQDFTCYPFAKAGGPVSKDAAFLCLLHNIFSKPVFKTDVQRYLDLGTDESVKTNLKYLLDLDCERTYFGDLPTQEWASLSKSLTSVDQPLRDLKVDSLKLKFHNTASMVKMLTQVVCGDRDVFAAASEKSLADQLSEARKITGSFDNMHFFGNVKFKNTDTTFFDYCQLSTSIQKIFAAIFNLLFNLNDEPIKEGGNAPKSAFLWSNLAPNKDEAKLLQDRILATHPDGAKFLESIGTSLLQQEIDLKLMLRAMSVFTYIYNPMFQRRLMSISNVIEVESIVLYMQFTFNLIYTSLLSLITKSRLAAMVLLYTAENKQRFPHLERILQYGETALSLLNPLVRKPVLHHFYFMSYPKDAPIQDLVFMEKAYHYGTDVLCLMRNALVPSTSNKDADKRALKLWSERIQPVLVKNMGQITDYLVSINLTYLLGRKAPHDLSCFYYDLHGVKPYLKPQNTNTVWLSQDRPSLSLPLQVVANVPSELVFADYVANGDSVGKVAAKIDAPSSSLLIDGLSFAVVENKNLYAPAELVFNPSKKKMLALMQPAWFAKFQAYVEHAKAANGELTKEDQDFAKELSEVLADQIQCRLACFRKLQPENIKGMLLTSSEYADDMSSVTYKDKTFKVFYDAEISMPTVVKASSRGMICLLPRAALGAAMYKEIDTMLANAIKFREQNASGGKQFEDYLMFLCNPQWNYWDRNWRGVRVLDDGSISFRDLVYEVRDSGTLLSAVIALDNNVEGLKPVIYMPKFLQKDHDVMRSLGSLLTYYYGDSLCMVLRNMRENLRKDFIRISGYVKTFKGNVSKYEQLFGKTEPERVKFLNAIVNKLDRDLNLMKNWSNVQSNTCQEMVKRCEAVVADGRTFPLVESSGRYKFYRYEYDTFYKAFDQAIDKLEHLKQALKSELPKRTRGPRSKMAADDAEAED